MHPLIRTHRSTGTATQQTGELETSNQLGSDTHHRSPHARFKNIYVCILHEVLGGFASRIQQQHVNPRMFGERVCLLLNVMTLIKREDKPASVIIAMPYLHF